MSGLLRPDLRRDEAGVLRSGSFDDIYYSPEDGLAESRFVFLGGNDLPQRLTPARGDDPFTVAELGFGTGLNILALMAEHDRTRSGPLSIWSCEGFPLNREEFAANKKIVAQRWPEITPYAEELAVAYGDPAPGEVTLNLSNDVTLTIAFGDVLASLRASSFAADAWFLDGFAPSRNPDMWSTDVFTEVSRLTAKGGTAATFSVASGVRSALEAAGFAWEKAPGFGRKRHMLRAARP